MPQGLLPPKPTGNEPLTRPTPIKGAYRPLPDDPNSRLRKLYDFIKGYIGVKPGLTDPNSTTATAVGDTFGQLNPIHFLTPMIGAIKGVNNLEGLSEAFSKSPKVIEEYNKTLGNRTISEAFEKSPKILQELRKPEEPIDIKKQLQDTLKLLKENKKSGIKK